MSTRGSRKLNAAWWLTLLAIVLVVAPTLATAIATALGVHFNWVVITGTELVTFLTMIWAGYFTSAVAEKHKAFIQDAEYNYHSETTWKTEKTEEVSGDQL